MATARFVKKKPGQKVIGIARLVSQKEALKRKLKGKKFRIIEKAPLKNKRKSRRSKFV